MTSNSKLVSPSSIAHFGLRTTPDRFKTMVKWHEKFWGGRIVIQNETFAMFQYDYEHHRLVILSDPNAKPVEDRRKAVGIYHISSSLKSLSELATSYEQKKAMDIVPHWPVNHGMTTSMYYFDPDGNEFELQVDNFDTPEEAQDFIKSPEFSINPVGVDINVEEWIERVRSGEDERAIKTRPNIGPRATRWENSLYFNKAVA
ncbi:uncharacterized protein BHQ10_007882 [Talaromyces amestolkiae]|uniref:VOC domain-containing protein n=1 Tax=Talaromyces amestolkiae TaxID=1196081 RepID=A0A364L7R4_TALAM|nr:uncharacterized protein BHQ10_007882 [Talaromyces amestolkiae]RAO71870.1 hypothetical protein BHQ10_007882 [Talaromyces amestolkiae]